MATWLRLSGRTVKGTQSTTDTPPAHGDMAGVNLHDVGGFAITFECDDGQSFSGAAGSFVAYYDDESVSGISRLPEMDIVLPAVAIGLQRVTVGGYTVATPRGFLAHIANGIQVTGGGLRVTYTCSTLFGDRT